MSETIGGVVMRPAPINPLRLWRWPATSVRSAVRMWQRDLTLYKRSWTRTVLPNFFEPLLYLAAFGVGLGLYIGKITGISYVVYIAPGLAAAAAMNGAIFETTYNVYVKLRFAKLYEAVITTPLEPEDVALGELMWAVTRSLIYGSAFLAVMAVLGYARTPLMILALPMFVLIGSVFALVGMLFTSLVPDIDLYSFFFTLFVTPVFLFSGIFFPVESLSGMKVIAWFSPLFHGTKALATGPGPDPLCARGQPAAAEVGGLGKGHLPSRCLTGWVAGESPKRMRQRYEAHCLPRR
jgi:lipooligosaccharide transport system permease protein